MRTPLLTLFLVLPTVAAAVDADADGYDAGVDCDDGDATIHPGATEIPLDGVDQDCDGNELCHPDQDADGFGRTGPLVPSAALGCDALGGADNALDCNDLDATVHPEALEVPADGVDSDCDTRELCFYDTDGDGYGGGSVFLSADLSCTTGAAAQEDGDCADDDAAVHPGATEACNGVDDDCNGTVDDGRVVLFEDVDADGYGGDTAVEVCGGAAPPLTGSIWVLVGGDCDDASTLVNPGRVEYCDDIDNDCDGDVDEGIGVRTWYLDADQDGFGDPDPALAIASDCAPPGFSPFGTDCHDADATIHPLIDETARTHAALALAPLELSEADRSSSYVGDGVDQDCDGVDLCFVDADLDGFGDEGGVASDPPVVPGDDLDCTDGSGATASEAGDCDDADPTVHPGATEVVQDGIDSDCDGRDGGLDRDGDGITDASDVCPLTADPDQADVDGDGVGDACDTCPLFGVDADQTDTDLDGFGDVCDNCPEAVNGDQADADLDGVGDACDPCPQDPTDSCGVDTGDTGDTGTTTANLTGPGGCQGLGAAYAWLLVLPLGWRRRRVSGSR